MNKQDRQEISLIQECISGQISVNELCKKLGVTPAGLGSRIIKLYRKEYDEINKE